MDEYLTVDEVAQRLKVSQKVIKDWLRAKKMPGTKIGSLWRIGEKDLERWLESNTQRPEAFEEPEEEQTQSEETKSDLPTIEQLLEVPTIVSTSDEEIMRLYELNKGMPKGKYKFVADCLKDGVDENGQAWTEESVRGKVAKIKASMKSYGVSCNQSEVNEAIDTILALKAEGKTYPAIADELNRLGMKTTRGGDWNRASVDNALRKANKQL